MFSNQNRLFTVECEISPSARPFGKLRATPLPLVGEGPEVRAAGVSHIIVMSQIECGLKISGDYAKLTQTTRRHEGETGWGTLVVFLCMVITGAGLVERVSRGEPHTVALASRV